MRLTAQNGTDKGTHVIQAFPDNLLISKYFRRLTDGQDQREETARSVGYGMGSRRTFITRPRTVPAQVG